MPTLKQRRAFKLVASSSSMKEAMRKGGYSKNTAIKPTQFTKSVGFRELCEEVGLTDHLITSSLTSDIIAKPKNRLGELTLAARLKGHLKDTDSGQQIVIHISNEVAQQNNLIKSDVPIKSNTSSS